MSIDPLTKQYPWYTPYQFSGNTPIQSIDLDGTEEYHYKLSLDKQGKTYLQQVGQPKLYNEHNWFGGMISFKTKINVERALVEYEGKKFYIGFAGSYGRGNENGMSLFNEFKKKPEAALFPMMFLSEDQSYSAESFSLAVQFQNNTVLYGTLTSKAWYTPQNNSPAAQKRLAAFLKFSPTWSKGSVSQAMKRFVPGIDGVLSGDGVKTNYFNPKTKIEVMVDNENNYFRIYDHKKTSMSDWMERYHQQDL